MNITITDQEKCRKQLRLEIPSQAVLEETDKVAGELARQVNVPGFRRGHVPKSVVKTRFRKELRDEVLAHILPHSLGDAIREKDLKVIGEPSIDNLKYGDDESIDVTFTIEVKPEFEISTYKSLPLTKRVYRIRDEDVEQTITGLREEQAELVPVEDRGAQAGDIVTATLTGSFEPSADKSVADKSVADEPASEEAVASEAGAGEAEDGEQKAEGQTDDASKLEAGKQEETSEQESEEVKEEDVEIEIGGEGVFKEFTEALTGAQAGETRTFFLSYPADYKPERFAGRSVNYTAEVTAVRAKELPKADDEFAQGVSEDFKTIDELRSHVRSTLEHEAEHRAQSESRAAAMEALVDSNRFDVPEFVVEKQMDSRLNTLISQLASQGIDPRQMKIDWKSIREGQRERAEREVRGTFILDRIAELENIEVGDEEVEREIEQYAQSMNQTVAALKARLTKEGALDSIKEQVRNRKALDLVLASAENKIEEIEGLRGPDAAADEGEPAEE